MQVCRQSACVLARWFCPNLLRSFAGRILKGSYSTKGSAFMRLGRVFFAFLVPSGSRSQKSFQEPFSNSFLPSKASCETPSENPSQNLLQSSTPENPSKKPFLEACLAQDLLGMHLLFRNLRENVIALR